MAGRVPAPYVSPFAAAAEPAGAAFDDSELSGFETAGPFIDTAGALKRTHTRHVQHKDAHGKYVHYEKWKATVKAVYESSGATPAVLPIGDNPFPDKENFHKLCQDIAAKLSVAWAYGKGAFDAHKPAFEKFVTDTLVMAEVPTQRARLVIMNSISSKDTWEKLVHNYPKLGGTGSIGMSVPSGQGKDVLDYIARESGCAIMLGVQMPGKMAALDTALNTVTTLCAGYCTPHSSEQINAYYAANREHAKQEKKARKKQKPANKQHQHQHQQPKSGAGSRRPSTAMSHGRRTRNNSVHGGGGGGNLEHLQRQLDDLRHLIVADHGRRSAAPSLYGDDGDDGRDHLYRPRSRSVVGPSHRSASLGRYRPRDLLP